MKNNKIENDQLNGLGIHLIRMIYVLNNTDDGYMLFNDKVDYLFIFLILSIYLRILNKQK